MKHRGYMKAYSGPEWLWQTGFGLLTAVAAYLVLSKGLLLDPDSWAYWEGSVSILKGHGYTYFGGQRIMHFPPLFSLYLSAVQSIAGISGFSLKLAVVFLAGLSGFIWCGLLLLLTKGAFRARIPLIIGFLYIALFIPAYYTTLLSEMLFLPVFGFLLLLIFYIDQDKGHHISGQWIAAVCLTEAGMLLTRNAALAFLPGAALVIFLRVSAPDLFRRFAIAGCTAIAPVLLWQAARIILQQSGSHPLAMHGSETYFGCLVQMTSGLADLFGSNRYHLGFFLLSASMLAVFFYFSASADRISPASRNAFHLFIIALLSMAGLYALFNITLVGNKLNERFLWHVPLIMVVILTVFAATTATARLRYWLTALLILLTLSQAARLVSSYGWMLKLSGRNDIGKFTVQQDLNRVVNCNFTISPDFISKQPVLQGEMLNISPPNYKWIARRNDK